MIIQFEYETLFLINYAVAFISLIFIIINYVGYSNCKKGTKHPIYRIAGLTNFIGIFIIFITLVLFASNSSNAISNSSSTKYYYIISNTIILLFLLVTFTNSANYFKQCKDTFNRNRKDKFNNNNSSTITPPSPNNISNNDNTPNTPVIVPKNGTLTTNAFALIGVIAMFVFSFNYK